MTRLAMAKLGLLASSLLPASANASTPESWANLDQRVNRACIAMSG